MKEMLLHGSTYPQFFIPTVNAKNRLIQESDNEVKGFAAKTTLFHDRV